MNVCCIPARGGSKGVPRKNVKLLAGKPLISYTIQAALESNEFDVVAVSSDDQEILAVAEQYGAVAVKRPAELATDTAGSLPVLKHCVEYLEQLEGKTCAYIALLQCTSPLRGARHIVEAFSLFKKSDDAASLVSTTLAKSSPYFSLFEITQEGSLKVCKTSEHPILRRQDAPKVYELNGAIYLWRRSAFFHDQKSIYPSTIMYLMDEEESIDIDTPIDFMLAELVMKKRKE